MNVLLKNGRLIDPHSGKDETTDILIEQGIITKIIPGINTIDGVQVVDMTDKIIAPGFIDIHVHLREPGYEHKETIETGCAAAAAGGFTAVCCMPNTNPAIDDESVAHYVQQKAKSVNEGIVNVYPVAAATKQRKGNELAPIAELVEAGAVGFSDDGSAIASSEMMRRVLEYASMYQKPIMQHAEDSSLTKKGCMNEGFQSTRLGVVGMPGAAEEIIVARDLILLKYTPKAKYHVCHVSTRGTIELLRQAKKAGLSVSCDVTPHHFTLTDENVETFDTSTKVNPPLRTKDDIEAIKQGLSEGIIEVIASDHAPHTIDEKEVEYTVAPFGMVGLETSVGLAMTQLVYTNVLTMRKMIEKFTINPRRIIGLSQIKIAIGEQANLTLIDPQKDWTVETSKFKSKSKNSPFNGYKLRGKAIGIYNNGLLRLAE
jgi:dihydroorotase